ncbi:hypothetical protein KGA66_08860 [Actinocrinis puniceicyclus]|uniref:Uncharacterized protein n=1 Tax=Actinocrinis puniceicyclus TaxID=977794 RepID=A0A8J7WKT7_9ACTN|nr:hypothetical protein [Actinocrinis puniceicyclus]MBS2963153.1 hypothetical protein [Actinocrinis puniceicyclus]
MSADWSTPGPDRPTDPRDELVQALLGLRWALPRTDADARVALDQLSGVAARLGQLAGEPADAQSPWEGQVQALLAQAGFALDWWRPVLDDVDLDWTLNHQAHLSADLARIASAGARILDQFAPSTPHPGANPPSAVTQGPPQPPPRVAAAFGSVPATAIVDPLANSGRHRRPAYEFDVPQSPPRPSASAPPTPAAAPPFESWPQQPQQPAPLPDTLDPELERLLRPQQPQPHAPAEPAGVPGAAEPGSAGPAAAGPPFSHPVAWAGPGSDIPGGEPQTDPGGHPDRRGPHAGMVVQAVGILGAVAALSWWAVSSLHLGSAPAGHPAAAQSQGAHPAASASAKAHPAASPTPLATHSAVTPVTTPPTSPPPPNAAGVTSIHVELLGGSPTVHQVAMILSVNTAGTGQVTVTVDYWGTKNGVKSDERTASWTLSGKTAYSIGASIPVDAYCGEQVTLKAASGDTTATQSTSPGC